MSEHISFTASATSYLRNLDRKDLRAPCFAVHFQAPPKELGEGRRSLGFIYPTLIVSGYVAKPQEFADKVALILEKHWGDYPDAPEQAGKPEGEAA